MKMVINIDNENCTIEIRRDGFRMAIVDFRSENNHGDLCTCLTEGEACKLVCEIAHSLNNEIDQETAFSQIKDNVNSFFQKRQIEL